MAPRYGGIGEEMKQKENQRVKIYVAYSLATITIYWLVSANYTFLGYGILNVAWIAATIFNFVNSIRLLRLRESRSLAITSLVISGVLLFLFVVGFGLGVIIEFLGA